MAHIIALLVAFKTDLTTSIWSVPVTNVDDIFCFNDVVAPGAMSAILDTGVCIPEDVTLGGAGILPTRISSGFRCQRLTVVTKRSGNRLVW